MKDHDLDKVEGLIGFGGGRLLLHEGLGEEHPGNADNRRYDEQPLDTMLARVHVRLTFRAVLLVILNTK